MPLFVRVLMVRQQFRSSIYEVFVQVWALPSAHVLLFRQVGHRNCRRRAEGKPLTCTNTLEKRIETAAEGRCWENCYSTGLRVLIAKRPPNRRDVAGSRFSITQLIIAGLLDCCSNLQSVCEIFVIPRSTAYRNSMGKSKPFTKQLRAALLNADETRYRISKATSISEGNLSRLVHDDASLSMESIDRICEHLGLRLIKDNPKKKSKPKGR